MSPVNTEHAGLAGELSHLLRAQPGGRMLVEVGVRTGDGVLSPDVAWCSDAFWQARRDEAPLESAPEICVELASSSNTRQALQAKVAAHLAAGAVVSWIVFPRSRRVDFHGASGVTAASSYSVDVSKLFD